MLRERIASYESARETDDVQAEPVRKSGPAPTVTAAADSKPQRMLSDEERSAMRGELSAHRGQEVWFETQANDPEADAFRRELMAVFREAGWAVADSSEAGYAIKAGIYLFMANDEPAAQVSVALRGLEAAGLDVVAGAGYREYYEKKKETDPNFRGHKFAPGQEFVIVIGPNPESTI
jgi:hypothetical protein